MSNKHMLHTHTPFIPFTLTPATHTHAHALTKQNAYGTFHMCQNRQHARAHARTETQFVNTPT